MGQSTCRFVLLVLVVARKRHGVGVVSDIITAMQRIRKPLTEEQRARKNERERETSRLLRLANPEKERLKNAKFRAQHPEWHKDYYKTNFDKYQELAKLYAAENRDRLNAYALDRYYKKKEQGALVRYVNKESARMRQAKRRSKTTGESLPSTFLPWLLVKQQCKCAACEKDISESYHADHITPLSRGGEHTGTNIQLLCPSCNLKKHAKDPIEWRQSLGQLI